MYRNFILQCTYIYIYRNIMSFAQGSKLEEGRQSELTRRSSRPRVQASKLAEKFNYPLESEVDLIEP